MLEFKYDTQLLIEGENLDEDEISEYFTEHFKGDCLLAVGDDELIKIHFHTNEPWKVLEYCASLGEIYDIVVSARFWSNSLNELVRVRNVQIVMEGITIGIVTFFKICPEVAPSIFAASIRSPGIF